jgi:hypothetical protein
VRATASERGWRRYATLGVRGVGTVWQRLRTASEDEVAQAPPAVVAAWAALQGHRWSDALIALGAFAGSDAARIKIGYETETVDGQTGEILPLENRYGEPTKRAAWIVDTSKPGWRLPLRRGGTIERERLGWHNEAEDSETVNEINTVTVIQTYPRAGVEPPAEDDWETVAREISGIRGLKRDISPPPQAPPSVPPSTIQPIRPLQAAA